ncbi:Fc receptor, IgE, high affinity I, gamma polypeptide like isoform X1 [Sphaeramia orbicularis]|uniref:Fc receptor, IgE, high affinity I, gamma polypeptide like isoform X1 n=1 Tax=Sphaeramia orbicularis TaxID=375764 RepID=UPI00117EF5AD|nr:high affinity immunoglobulin epsilon receptor subunit gamma-like isoform X1 [Sphaeramia orbicularis]
MPSKDLHMLPATIGDMNICYILDGVLILYGLILTALYCRLRITYRKSTAGLPEKKPAEGGIYAVRLLSLMIKNACKKAHDGQVTAYITAHGSDLA